jgi:nucleotidyltransferase
LKALFLVGGKGTRLRPLTEKLPKPMVPVMGVPLLQRNFDRLKTFGIQEIVLSTCYKPECIEQYFGSGANYGLQIHYVSEDLPLGTGGAIKNAERYFDKEPFFIFNADIISDINFGEMLRFHKRKNADVTIAVTRVDNPSAYGVIEYDDHDYAITFREKPKPHEVVSHYINAGVYIFNPQILKHIPAGRPVSVEREVFPKLLEKGKRIAVYKGCNYWLDLGTPEKYMQAHMDAFQGLYRIDEADFEKEPIYGRFNAKISGKAILRGPVYLGKDVRIEAGAIVGPNAVIGDRCCIGKKCRIENSILWNDVTVENGVEIIDSIVADECRVGLSTSYEKVIFAGDASKRLAIS